MMRSEVQRYFKLDPDEVHSGVIYIWKDLPFLGLYVGLQHRSVLSEQSFLSCVLDPLAFSFLDFIGLGRQLTALSEVKMCSVVFVSTLLPSSFSLGRILSILCLETGCRPATGFSLPCGKVSWTAPHFFLPTMSQSTLIVQIMFFLSVVQTNHGEVACFITFIFS